MELISVVVPVYRVEKYLQRCVDSICAQTYDNLEIILVDDGSPDKCPQMCDVLMQRDSRIKVIHKENGGLAFARNSGLDIASGVYVIFIDSDDWITPDHIENLYAAVKRTQADVVIGAHTEAFSNGTMRAHPLRLAERVYEGTDIVDKILLPLIGPEPDYPDDIMIQSSSCMNLYRMSIIRKHNLRFISEKYAIAEDMHFNVDYLCHAGRVTAVNETGYCYFQNQTSISRKYDPNRIQRTFRFHQILHEKTAWYGIEERCAFRIDRSYLMKVRVAIRLITDSMLSKKEKMEQIRGLLEHEITRAVLQRYPIEKYQPAMRLLMWMMRREWVTGVYYLMKIRERMRGNRIFRFGLRLIGIGR